jgi:NADPH-dependent 2,4-dienoyl-CoA reductase/sulfur reductase-like enzyme
MPVVIIGAGPAGIRAAQTLVAHGLRPVLLDEAARGGGQIYRRQPANFKRSPVKLYTALKRARPGALHQTIDELREQLEYRPETLVWNAEDGALDTLQRPCRHAWSFPA